jgi:heterotetrameric sarcosine oxidase delta subunit
MLLIPCPHCGPRSEVEFRYGGPPVATPSDTATDEEWAGYLFVRDNSEGPLSELWCHDAGCRRWFTITRNTLTNEFGHPMQGVR